MLSKGSAWNTLWTMATIAALPPSIMYLAAQ
jgi:ABC-type glycerol-3-phosphate transport system permease component